MPRLIRKQIVSIAAFVLAITAMSMACAQDARDSFNQQPTDPCKIVSCDPSPSLGVVQTIALANREDVSPSAIARRCQAAVSQYRPEAGGPRIASAFDAYVEACFRAVESIETTQRQILENSVFQLEVGGTSCTGVLLADGIALTARHCFVRGRDQIAQHVLEGAKLKWISGARVFEATGVRVVRDPIQFGGSASTDYIFIGTREPLDLPSTHRARLATPAEARAYLRSHSRVQLPSFVAGQQRLLIDDFNWCLILTVNEARGFFKHHCQALPGSSGAPLLVWDVHGVPVVLGIHAGASGDLFQDGELPGSNEATIIR